MTTIQSKLRLRPRPPPLASQGHTVVPNPALRWTLLVSYCPGSAKGPLPGIIWNFSPKMHPGQLAPFNVNYQLYSEHLLKEVYLHCLY